MGGADPLGVGLENRPDEHQAEMVGAECGDRVEVAADRVGVPVVPAEPPVVGRRVIHAEAMAGEIEPGRRGVSRTAQSLYELTTPDGHCPCRRAAADKKP